MTRPKKNTCATSYLYGEDVEIEAIPRTLGMRILVTTLIREFGGHKVGFQHDHDARYSTMGAHSGENFAIESSDLGLKISGYRRTVDEFPHSVQKTEEVEMREPNRSDSGTEDVASR